MTRSCLFRAPGLVACTLLVIGPLFGCAAGGGGKKGTLLAEAPVAPEPAGPAGFYVRGRHLYDRCGERVVLRGVNDMVVIQNRDGLPAFREIAKTGANTVRIMWLRMAPPHEFDETLTNAVEAGLIPMIELHDATGQWERLGEVVDYWTDPETVAVINRHQEYLLVNIANEAGDGTVTDEQFKEGYRDAIVRMRSAGIRTPLVIDAAGWGRDADQLLRTAPWLLEQDPDRNLVFSVHWWHSDNDRAEITRAFEAFVESDLPLIIGEFAHKEVGCQGQIAYPHILAEGERLGIGWLAWSWSPGNADCGEMDMTEDGSYETLHDWGLEVAVTDPHSIQNTARRPESIVSGRCADAR